MNRSHRMAWAAGIVDGEGCIHIKRQRRKDSPNPSYTLVVRVGQSGNADAAPSMLVELKRLFGGTIHLSRRESPALTKRPTWEWGVAAATAESMLREISEYLVAKQRQAAIALRYRDNGVGRGDRRRLSAAAQKAYEALRAAKR